MAKKKKSPEEQQGLQDQQSSSKDKLFEIAMSQVQKELGAESVMSLLDPRATVDMIPTDFISLNHAIGGGIPRKRVTEIYSSPGAGKSSLALHVIAKVQQAGGRAVFIDAETALNPSLARCMGVKLEDLYVIQPEYGEQAMDMLIKLLRTGAVDLFVVDSVHALTPKSVMEGLVIDNHMAELARLLSKSVPVIRNEIVKTNSAVIFINQMRDKIGGMGMGGKTTPGGNTLPFYSDVRIRAAKCEKIKAGESVVGHVAEFTCEKSRFTSPYKQSTLEYIYGEGFCKYRELIELALDNNIMGSSGGGYYKYEGETIAQGKANLVAILKSSDELFNKIKGEVLEAYAEQA